jgi:RNA polymerase sigma-70 factor (ECF subfamily)
MADEGDPLLTHLLNRVADGDPAALGDLLPLVYSQLRALASRHMARERAGHTLQPTALVHEAYLKLVHGEAISWSSRAHFFGVAARLMRQVLVDQARRRAAVKRAGNLERVTFNDEVTPDVGRNDFDVIDVHRALEKLNEKDRELARIAELRFFGDLTLDEVAHVTGRSRRKVAKDWSFARVWLARELA